METNLLRLIDLDKVDILLEGFNKSTGFVTAILDLKGNIYSKSGWRQICTEFHRINPETSKRCTISDTELAGKIADGEKYHFYKCLNGLVDVAVPIIINGQHIANLFSGQFFLEKPDYLFFKNQAAKYGFDENRYMEALEKVPVVSKEKVLVAMDFLQNMTQLISEMTFQKLEQTELNKALKESEERLKSIFNNLQDAFFQADLKGNFTLISPSAASMYGYLSTEEMIGMPAISLYADHTVRDSLLKELSAKEGVVKDFITLAKRKDNSTFWVSMNVRYLYNNGKIIGTEGVVRDITERKKSEEELLKSNENLAITLNSIGDAVISTDINGLIVQMNPIAEQLCGWRLADALFKPLSEVFKIINAQTRQPVIDPVKKVLKKGEIVGLANHTVLISRYGNEYQISDSAAPIKNKNNEITGVVLVFSDISDKYAAELALKESEERYKALHNASFGGITIHDKGKIIECNQGLSEITGYSYEELIGMDGLLLISSDTRDLVLNNILAGYEKPYEALGLRKNGEIFPLRLEARNVPYKGKVVRTVEFRDITETKQSELQIKRKSEEVEFQNQRLESLLEISQYQTNSVQELLDFALNEAIVLTNSKIGYIYFY
ncbi:MAG: PAS domain S-box protein, partial [Bacteroidales bacterium]|nr:PAS domain S-box protein [Bacteroidales bacterium]